MYAKTYTQVDNMILHGICKLKFNEARVLLFVVRYSVGYHRDEFQTTYSEMEKWTGINKHNLFPIVRGFADVGILKVDGKKPIYIKVDFEKLHYWLLEKVETDECLGC